MKNFIKYSFLGLIYVTVFSSCISEVEMPKVNDVAKPVEESLELFSGFENLRTIPFAYNYIEEFDNQIFFIPVDELDAPQGLYPGTGVGRATRLGKGKISYSFINQLAQFNPSFQLVTKGAPVMEVFSLELEAMGLTDIPSKVSSVTTDGEGNAIWFENIENITRPESPEKTSFHATIKVVGGNGRFAKAFGIGEVEGYFNPLNGAGKSIVRARINY